MRLIDLNGTFDAGVSAKFTDNPGRGGGSCFGDSALALDFVREYL